MDTDALFDGKISITCAFVVVGLMVLTLMLSLWGNLGTTCAALTELRVCPSGCAYISIQAAVDAANAADVIKVAQGTYTDLHVR